MLLMYYNLEATITLEPEIFDELYAQNASMAGFLPGENAKIIDPKRFIL